MKLGRALAVSLMIALTACAGSQPEVDTEGGLAGGAGAGTSIDGLPRSGGIGAPGTGVDSADLGAPRPGTQEDLQATIGDRVFFGFDQYDLSSEARDTADAWAQWLQRYSDLDVTIEGHADERGTREYNLALGDRRAAAVRNYLVSLGISPNRLNTISYGKERPAVLGSSEAAWAQNRRAVLTVN